MSTLTTFTTLDSRKRINLASIATRDSYQVTREESGRIILDPAVVLTEVELAALQNTEMRDMVAKSRATGGRNPRPRS
ncbi:hypothetical protein BIV03_01000 [Curtobacterium sp. MCBA15_016]|uniref:hypothetical protein n=1 Tax=Curtobacterium sp. MCBA15_016 TaxID=1898740 RepID=UPI0008DE9B73|nr:hypothetical protein [Curtobacterium sp. MCBA15_016]OII28861.1 hypothetical protein BIV03_01000 [Curtobacterium sp. MCBA15_016]